MFRMLAIGVDPFIEFGFLRWGEDKHTGKEFVAECRTLRRGECEYLLSEVSGHHTSQYYAGRLVSSSETIIRGEPAAPRFAFTARYASHTARLEIPNGFVPARGSSPRTGCPVAETE